MWMSFFDESAGKEYKAPFNFLRRTKFSPISMPLIHLASAICLSVLSFTTITSNLLLLVAVWKDPFKCFSAPTTAFIVALSLADLMTALTTEPFFAAYYFVVYFQESEAVSSVLTDLSNTGSVTSSVAISFSFLIVLALSWSQYVALKFPHNFKRVVNKRNITTFVVLSLVYLLCFTSVQFMGVDKYSFLKVSLAVNSTFLSVNLMFIMFILNLEFRRYVKRQREASSFETTTDRKTGSKNLQQQFTAVTIYLAGILLLSALPHVVTAQIYLYFSDSLSPQGAWNFQIALQISDLLLFLKVCLDTFVYAWRLPIYRRTIKTLFCSVVQ